jgi:hypothetical protein
MVALPITVLMDHLHASCTFSLPYGFANREGARLPANCVSLAWVPHITDL